MYGQIKIWDQTVTPNRYMYVWATYWYTGTAAVIILVVALWMKHCYHQVFMLRSSRSAEATKAAQNTAASEGIPDGDLTLTRELKRRDSMNVVAAGVSVYMHFYKFLCFDGDIMF